MEEGGDSSAEKSKGNVQLSIWLDFSLLQQPNIFLEKTVQVIILLISVFCPTLKNKSENLFTSFTLWWKYKLSPGILVKFS